MLLQGTTIQKPTSRRQSNQVSLSQLVSYLLQSRRQRDMVKTHQGIDRQNPNQTRGRGTWKLPIATLPIATLCAPLAAPPARTNIIHQCMFIGFQRKLTAGRKIQLWDTMRAELGHFPEGERILTGVF